jgi:hypothetical protein
MEDMSNILRSLTMKLNKPALSLMALIGAIYMTPTAFAGATDSGSTSTPGTSSGTTTTPSGNVAPDPATPATRANDTPSSGTGATAHDRSDVTKTGEMKSKSMRNCNPSTASTDPSCEQLRPGETR